MKKNKIKNLKTESNYWTKEECEILEEFYPNGGYVKCIEKGLSRSKMEMAMKYKYCGYEIKMLKTLDYGDVPIRFDLDSTGEVIDYIESTNGKVDYEIRTNTNGELVAFAVLIDENTTKRLTLSEFNELQ